MHGSTIPTCTSDVATELRSRIDATASDRLGQKVGMILDHALALVEELQPTEADLDAFLQFLTDVGEATDARRQEWVLLADVFGLSALVSERTSPRTKGGTLHTLPGPFYRPDAPRMKSGENLCRNGSGTQLKVEVRVTALDGSPVRGAEVEVWHANEVGRYENQDPDNQPEHNLRGRFVTDEAGRISFLTVRPGGYALPADGPVGKLARRLGMSLDRPAHIHFATTAQGYCRLVTAIFDAIDPAIARDALFAVRPPLIADFPGQGDTRPLKITLVLTPESGSTAPAKTPE